MNRSGITVGICLLSLAGLATGCAKPDSTLEDSNGPAVTGSDAAVDKPLGTTDAAVDAGATSLEPTCAAGQHVCAGICVRNDSVSFCGASCSPCDLVPDGTATCDGTRCGATCPANKKLCNGTCIDAGAACAAQCPTGTHACNGQCPSSQSVNACGTSCTPCPLPAGASMATCDGTKCDFICSTGFHRCGDRCVRDEDATACGTSCMACPADPGGAGAAQCVGGTCTIRCNAGNHACNGRCVSDTSSMTCGSSCDPCPVPTGGTATCTQGTCGGTCPANKKLCKGACIDSNAACDGQCAAGTHACSGVCAANNSVNSCGTSSCQACPRPTGAANVTCDGNACDFTCGSGYHRCGATCAPDDSATACGASCTSCPTDPNGSAICQNGSCSVRCFNGLHLCNGKCVQNNAVATCGNSCNACQSPSGGSVSCDGVNCVPACPNGQKICNGQCINNNQACNGQCPANTHNCNGMCVSNNDVNTCGGRCSPCPGAASHGSAGCNNGTCVINCENTYRNCNGTNLCVSSGITGCCNASDCDSGGDNTVASCNASNICSYQCNPQTHMQCGGQCIVKGTQCCSSNDCVNSTGGPVCNLTTNMCEKRKNGEQCTAHSECVGVQKCLDCAPDGDGDGYGAKWGTVKKYCGACPAPLLNDRRDCHDGNASVKPGVTTYYSTAYSTQAGDTSNTAGWDWNCDGKAEKRLILVPVRACAATTCSADKTCPVTTMQREADEACGAALANTVCEARTTAAGACSCSLVKNTSGVMSCR